MAVQTMIIPFRIVDIIRVGMPTGNIYIRYSSRIPMETCYSDSEDVLRVSTMGKEFAYIHSRMAGKRLSTRHFIQRDGTRVKLVTYPHGHEIVGELAYL